jgi:hypothetical protein
MREGLAKPAVVGDASVSGGDAIKGLSPGSAPSAWPPAVRDRKSTHGRLPTTAVGVATEVQAGDFGGTKLLSRKQPCWVLLPSRFLVLSFGSVLEIEGLISPFVEGLCPSDGRGELLPLLNFPSGHLPNESFGFKCSNARTC